MNQRCWDVKAVAQRCGGRGHSEVSWGRSWPIMRTVEGCKDPMSGSSIDKVHQVSDDVCVRLCVCVCEWERETHRICLSLQMFSQCSLILSPLTSLYFNCAYFSGLCRSFNCYTFLPFYPIFFKWTVGSEMNIHSLSTHQYINGETVGVHKTLEVSEINFRWISSKGRNKYILFYSVELQPNPVLLM